MYFSKATVIALISALGFASASPLLGVRQNGVTCQTSTASPEIQDVTFVINELKGRGGSCPQENGAASDCTTLVTQESGAIAVCGGVDDATSALTCEEVANFANQVQQTCKSAAIDRAGGTFTVSPSKRVVVFNSADA